MLSWKAHCYTYVNGHNLKSLYTKSKTMKSSWELKKTPTERTHAHYAKQKYYQISCPSRQRLAVRANRVLGWVMLERGGFDRSQAGVLPHRFHPFRIIPLLWARARVRLPTGTACLFYGQLFSCFSCFNLSPESYGLFRSPPPGAVIEHSSYIPQPNLNLYHWSLSFTLLGYRKD